MSYYYWLASFSKRQHHSVLRLSHRFDLESSRLFLLLVTINCARASVGFLPREGTSSIVNDSKNTTA
jgi:hypothetical protein